MSLGRRVRNTGSLACELVLLLLPPLRMIDVFIEREREKERERERKHASSDILTRIVLDETNRKEIIE
jgi:hypothetical protein